MAEFNENELNEAVGGNTGSFGPYITYQIQPGECLSVIAKHFGCTVNELVKLNNIANPDKIRAFDTLLIPRKY